MRQPPYRSRIPRKTEPFNEKDEPIMEIIPADITSAGIAFCRFLSKLAMKNSGISGERVK